MRGRSQAVRLSLRGHKNRHNKMVVKANTLFSKGKFAQTSSAQAYIQKKILRYKINVSNHMWSPGHIKQVTTEYHLTQSR